MKTPWKKLTILRRNCNFHFHILSNKSLKFSRENNVYNLQTNIIACWGVAWIFWKFYTEVNMNIRFNPARSNLLCSHNKKIVKQFDTGDHWLITYSRNLAVLNSQQTDILAPADLCYPQIILWYKRTECEPSQFGSSREQSSRDKGSSSVFWKYMSTVNWNMFRMCMSIIDWNSSPSFLAPLSPQIKLGGPSQ